MWILWKLLWDQILFHHTMWNNIPLKSSYIKETNNVNINNSTVKTICGRRMDKCFSC